MVRIVDYALDPTHERRTCASSRSWTLLADSVKSLSLPVIMIGISSNVDMTKCNVALVIDSFCWLYATLPFDELLNTVLIWWLARTHQMSNNKVCSSPLYDNDVRWRLVTWNTAVSGIIYNEEGWESGMEQGLRNEIFLTIWIFASENCCRNVFSLSFRLICGLLVEILFLLILLSRNFPSCQNLKQFLVSVVK